jgi:alpha-N-arabinofuranosidase
MAQGSRVTGNLFHDNGKDLFIEVNHGPFMVDNNIFLSDKALDVQSDGGAFAHNLIGGNISARADLGRKTPFHKAHSTELVGLRRTELGDVRYYNNLVIGSASLGQYDSSTLPVWMDGNIFLRGAKPSQHELTPLVNPELDPQLKLSKEEDGFYLELSLDKEWGTQQTRKLVETALLGKASISNLPFENENGTPLRINTDYFGNRRNEQNPFPGPFERVDENTHRLRVWPPSTY